MSDDRPSVYFEEDDDGACWWVIRASAIGGCLYELVAAGQELDALDLPAVLVRAFREGHEKEHEAIEWLEDNGWRMISQQREGELIVRYPDKSHSMGTGIKVRYHPDGIGVAPGYFLEMDNAEVVEVKWLSNDNWQKAIKYGVGVVVDEYNWQLSVMMHAEDKPARWVYGNKGYAPDDKGVKRHCEDEGRIAIQAVASPPVSLADIREKAIRIIELVTGDDLLQSDLGCTNPGQFPCRYRHLLPTPGTTDEERGEILYIEDESQAADVERLVREYLYCKGQEDELKKRKEDARDALISIAGGKETRVKKIITPKWTVPIVHGRSASKINWSKMGQSLRDRVNQFREEGNPTRFLRDIKRND